MLLRHRIRELRELGLSRSAFRVAWELKRRSGISALLDRAPVSDSRTATAVDRAPALWRRRPLFTQPADVRSAIEPFIDEPERQRLLALASAGSHGRIQHFSDGLRDCGDPINWHRDALSGTALNASIHCARALATIQIDVKDVWELGRFPHAFAMGRAATMEPQLRAPFAAALERQICGFIESNPFARGLHWSSGQEIAFRCFAWTFAIDTLFSGVSSDGFLRKLADHLILSGAHIERHVEYARRAVYNNHLLSDATGMMLVSFLVPEAPAAERLWSSGKSLLDEGVERQFYADGGYIQLSHNYHRVALQDLTWAAALCRRSNRAVPAAWQAALQRSRDFLVAQATSDGRLPNYGSNDGALVSPLSASPYEDFRPALQAASICSTGTRCYPAGAWDEESIWFHGPMPSLAHTPEEPRSASFGATGFHVMRGNRADTFCMFRCGDVLDRFTQMDMLHVDIHWRGENVVCDPGSFRYNASDELNEHFTGTASHNTLTVDGADQMVRIRKFKLLYPTQARLERFVDNRAYALGVGEHYGYQRLPGAPVHRRAVLYIKDDLWIVVDTVTGANEHDARLHWLMGGSDGQLSARGESYVLQTRRGPFAVRVLDGDANPQRLDVECGREHPPRGWLSRRYGSKHAVASLAVSARGRLPITLVSLLGDPEWMLEHREGQWRASRREQSVVFACRDGVPADVRVDPV